MSNVRLTQHSGYIFFVRTAMTPTQIEIVRDSFHLINRRSRDASRIFYEELFRMAPEMRKMFPEDLTVQHAKFIQMVSAIVNSLDHVNRISDYVADLGRRHMAYDVENEHYAIFGEAFLSMLEKLLDRDLTQSMTEAWEAAYDMLARMMREACEGPFTSEAFFGTVIRSVVTAQYGVSIAKQRNVAGRAPITHGIDQGEVIRLSPNAIIGTEMA